jgi:hypothetical protein
LDDAMIAKPAIRRQGERFMADVAGGAPGGYGLYVTAAHSNAHSLA